MANIKVYINRQLADFQDFDNLPLSLRKATDNLLGIAIAEGTTVDNSISSLTLPSTKNNIKIAGCPDNPNIRRKQTLDNIFIEVDGVQVFNGTGYLNNQRLKCDFSTALVYQLLGDGYSLWNRMEGFNLDRLDLGCIDRTLDNILTSFNETYDDGQTGIFAPVIYGQTNGDSGQQINGGSNTINCNITTQNTGLRNETPDIVEVRSISINGTVYELDTTYDSSDSVLWQLDVESQITNIIAQNDELSVGLVQLQYSSFGGELQILLLNANFEVDYIGTYYQYNNFPLPDTTFVNQGSVTYSECKDNTAFAVTDFLYHPYHRAILEALFVGEFCHSIESKFLNSEWFKEQVYIATDKNIQTDRIEYPNRVVALSGNTVYQDGENIIFSSEPQDTFNELSGGVFVASQQQTYTFEIEVGISSVSAPNTTNAEKQTIALVIQNGTSSAINFLSFNIELPTPNTFAFDLPMEAGDSVALGWRIFPVFQTDDNGDIQFCEIEANTELTVKRANDECLQIASLLHDKPVKEYLRGLFHQYNLAVFIDPIRCIAIIEPRFDYEINGEKCEGFYKRVKEYVTECLSCEETTIEYVNPYGRSLTLGYCADGENDFAKVVYDTDNDSIIYGGARFELNQLSTGGKTNRNPFFCDLLLGQFDSINSTSLPTILQDYERGEALPVWNATYDNPKTALIHRNLATIYIEGVGEIEAPLLAQYLSDCEPNGNPITWDALNSYADVIATDSNGNVKRIKGLATTFYTQYAAIIREQQKLRGNFNKGFCDILAENFRSIKKVDLGGCNVSEWILMEISGFNPLRDGLTQQCFLKYRCVDVKDCYLLDHWNIDDSIEITTECDYTVQIGRTGAETITDIRWCDYKTLQLNYPYRTNSTVDAARLQDDLTQYLCSIGYTNQNVNVIDQAGIWTIIFQASELCALDIITENQTTGEMVYNSFTCYNVPVCDYCIVANFLDAVPRISNLILQDGSSVPLPSYPYLIPSQSQNFIDDLTAYYSANNLVFQSIDVLYDGANNMYEVKVIASELKLAGLFYGSVGQASAFANAQESNCSGDIEFDCDLFLISINQVSENIDCVYRLRLYHPTTNEEGSIELSIGNNDDSVRFDYRCLVTKNCVGEDGVNVKDQIEQGFDRPFSVEVRGSLDVGDYITTLRVYNAQTGLPIDLDISPTSSNITGAFGTVTALDLTFNGSNHASMITSVETVIKNALDALGFTPSQYEVFTNFNVITDVFSIRMYPRHNPSGAFIGINKNDGYFTFFDSSTNNLFNTIDIAVQPEQYILTESEFTPCGLIVRAYGIIDNADFVDEAASNYNNIVLSTNVLSNLPLYFIDNNERTCVEQRTVLTANYSLCPEMPTFLWSTGETTQSITVSQSGTYSVTVTCGACVKTESITV